jgi:hypothetical protein
VRAFNAIPEERRLLINFGEMSLKFKSLNYDFNMIIVIFVIKQIMLIILIKRITVQTFTKESQFRHLLRRGRKTGQEDENQEEHHVSVLCRQYGVQERQIT